MTQLLLWAKSESALFIVLALIASYLAKELLLFQLKRSGRIVYFILFPGVVIHELSHFIACIITFTKVKNVSLYQKGGGFVIYEKPKNPLVNFVISIAPLALGLTISYFIFRELSVSLYRARNIIILYLGISVSLSMFPSAKDHQNALEAYLIVVPVIALILYFMPPVHLLNNQTATFLVYFVGALVAINVVVFVLREFGWKSH